MSNTVSRQEKKKNRQYLKDLVATLKKKDNSFEDIKSALQSAYYEGYGMPFAFSVYGDDGFTEDTDEKDNFFAILTTPDRSTKNAFYLYHKEDGEEPTIEQVSFDKVLELVQPENETIPKPEKPSLGFWGTLRNTFSFLFGKPEKQIRYEQEMELYRAKKSRLLESENFGFKNLDYNKKILLEQPEPQRETLLPQRETLLQQPEVQLQQPEVQSVRISVQKHRAAMELLKMLSNDPSLTESVSRGIDMMTDYLEKHPDTPLAVRFSDVLDRCNAYLAEHSEEESCQLVTDEIRRVAELACNSNKDASTVDPVAFELIFEGEPLFRSKEVIDLVGVREDVPAGQEPRSDKEEALALLEKMKKQEHGTEISKNIGALIDYISENDTAQAGRLVSTFGRCAVSIRNNPSLAHETMEQLYDFIYDDLAVCTTGGKFEAEKLKDRPIVRDEDLAARLGLKQPPQENVSKEELSTRANMMTKAAKDLLHEMRMLETDSEIREGVDLLTAFIAEKGGTQGGTKLVEDLAKLRTYEKTMGEEAYRGIRENINFVCRQVKTQQKSCADKQQLFDKLEQKLRNGLYRTNQVKALFGKKKEENAIQM